MSDPVNLQMRPQSAQGSLRSFGWATQKASVILSNFVCRPTAVAWSQHGLPLARKSLVHEFSVGSVPHDILTFPEKDELKVRPIPVNHKAVNILATELLQFAGQSPANGISPLSPGRTR